MSTTPPPTPEYSLGDQVEVVNPLSRKRATVTGRVYAISIDLHGHYAQWQISYGIDRDDNRLPFSVRASEIVRKIDRGGG